MFIFIKNGFRYLIRETSQLFRKQLQIFERKFEKSLVHHAANLETLDGFQQESQLKRGPVVVEVFHFLVAGCIGVVMSIIYLIFYFSSHKLEHIRLEIFRENFISNSNIVQGWVYSLLISILFAVIGTVIVFYCPVASGSGMPEIITYLNGIKFRKFTSLRTLILKMISVIMVVSSGLFTGYDGPLIHCGLILGIVVIKFCVKKLPLFLFGVQFTDTLTQNIVSEVESNKSFLKMAAIGAATGLTAAFKSPLGGVMFAIEEAITFYEPVLLLQTMFACMITYTICAMVSDYEENGFILNPKNIAFFPSNESCLFASNYVDIIIYIVFGVLLGILGAAYNRIIMQSLKFTLRYLNRKPFFRLLEVILLVFLTTSITVLLPYFFSDRCTPFYKIVDHAEYINQVCRIKCDKTKDHVSCFERICLPQGSRDDYLSKNTERFNEIEAECGNATDSHLKMPFPAVNIEMLAGAVTPPETIISDMENRCYFQFPSLFLETPTNILKNLFTRGMYNIFDHKALSGFLLIYTCLSTMTYNTMLPTDPVIPNLIIGACLGRMCGLLINMIKSSLFSVPVDPGVYAILGAAGFWAGTARICVTIAIVITESTLDLSLLLPTLIVVVMSTITGNCFGHSQYHKEIHVKCLPFLPPVPSSRLKYKVVKEIMKPLKDIIFFEENERVSSVYRKLASCTYSAFPVLRGEYVAGSIQRNQLKHIFKTLDTFEPRDHMLFEDAMEYELQAPNNPITDSFELLPFGHIEDKRTIENDDRLLEISHYMTKPVFTVYEEMSVSKAYNLLRQLGLHHIFILQTSGQLSGMITRFDFLKLSDH
jgi:H+/Cl- antiporter ClcA/predicted transcriptional regulator